MAGATASLNFQPEDITPLVAQKLLETYGEILATPNLFPHGRGANQLNETLFSILNCIAGNTELWGDGEYGGHGFYMRINLSKVQDPRVAFCEIMNQEGQNWLNCAKTTLDQYAPPHEVYQATLDDPTIAMTQKRREELQAYVNKPPFEVHPEFKKWLASLQLLLSFITDLQKHIDTEKLQATTRAIHNLSVLALGAAPQAAAAETPRFGVKAPSSIQITHTQIQAFYIGFPDAFPQAVGLSYIQKFIHALSFFATSQCIKESTDRLYRDLKCVADRMKNRELTVQTVREGDQGLLISGLAFYNYTALSQFVNRLSAAADVKAPGAPSS